MVSKTQLLKNVRGIFGRLQRQKQAEQQLQQAQAQLQTQTAQQTLTPQEIDKQKEAQRVYNEAKREADLWAQAESLVMRGKGWTTKGDPELNPKVRAIERGEREAMKTNALYLQKAGFDISRFGLGDKFASMDMATLNRDTLDYDFKRDNAGNIIYQDKYQFSGAGDISKLPKAIQEQIFPQEVKQDIPATQQSIISKVKKNLNGYSSIIRTPNSNNISMGRSQSILNNIRNWGGRYFSTLAEDVKKKQTPFINITTPRGTFVSAYPSGQGTDYYTPLTQEQEKQFAEVKEKEQAILTSPIKFISELEADYKELAKQKDIELFGQSFADKNETTLSEKYKYAEETPTSELIAKGQAPLILYKASGEVGSLFHRGVSKVIGHTPSQEEKEIARELFGTLFLTSGFSPLIKTGASGTIQKQLSKNKFDKLKQLLNKIEKDLLNEKDRAKQLKYLAELKQKYNVGDEGMNNLIKHLEEKEILKLQKVTIGESSSNVLIDIEGLPQMEQAGTITGFVSASSVQPSRIKETIPLKVKETLWVKQEPYNFMKIKPIISPRTKTSQKTRQPQKEKEITKFFQPTALRQQQLLKQRQTQKSRLATSSLFGQRQIPRQRLTPKPKPFFKIGIDYTKPRKPKKPIIKFSSGTQKLKKTTGTKKRDLFIPEVRRKGKFEAIGKPVDFFKAVSIGKGEVLKTLGASFRVKTKKGDVVPLVPSGVFRKAKKGKGILIQKKEKRLTAISERKAIQKARKMKKWYK